MSFFLFLSFSLSGYFFEAQRPSEFTFLPRLLRPSWEGALHFHPIERVPEASVNRPSPMSGTILVFCINQGISASFSSLLSYRRLWTTRFQSIKGPQHMTKGCKWVAWAGSPDSSHTCCCIIAPPPQLTPVVHIYDQLTKERQSQAWFIDELTWYVDASWKQTAYSTAPGAILIDGGEGKSF